MNHFQKQISESISWLRFPLVLMVVFIHSSGFGEFQTDSFNFSALSDINSHRLRSGLLVLLYEDGLSCTLFRLHGLSGQPFFAL